MQFAKASKSLRPKVIHNSSIIKPLHARTLTNHPPKECQCLAPPPMPIHVDENSSSSSSLVGSFDDDAPLVSFPLL